MAWYNNSYMNSRNAGANPNRQNNGYGNQNGSQWGTSGQGGYGRGNQQRSGYGGQWGNNQGTMMPSSQNPMMQGGHNGLTTGNHNFPLKDGSQLPPGVVLEPYSPNGQPPDPNAVNQINQLNQSNQLNQANQMNQSNQLNQANQMNQMNQANQPNQNIPAGQNGTATGHNTGNPMNPDIAPQTQADETLSQNGIEPEKPEEKPEFGLSKFIQNERNAMIYYQNLASKAVRPHNKRLLLNMSSDCSMRQTRLTELHKKMGEVEFSPVESEIDTRDGFAQGVRRAIEEESGSVKELVVLYENAQSDNQAALNAIIYRKLSDIGILCSML